MTRCEPEGALWLAAALAFVMVLSSPGIAARAAMADTPASASVGTPTLTAGVQIDLVAPMMNYAVVPPRTSFQFTLAGAGFDAAQYAFDASPAVSPCFSYFSGAILYNVVCDAPATPGMHVLAVDALNGSTVVASRTFVLFVDASVGWPLDTMSVNVVLVGFDEPPSDLAWRLYSFWGASSQVTQDPATALNFQIRLNYAVQAADPAYAAALLTAARGAAAYRTDLQARLNLSALVEQRDTGVPMDIFDPLAGYELPSSWLESYVQANPPVPGLTDAGYTFYLVNLTGLDDPANGTDHWFVRPVSDTDTGRLQDWWRLEWDNALNTPMGYPMNIFGGPDHRVFIDPTAYQWYLDWTNVWWNRQDVRAPYGYEYEETPVADRPQYLADRVNDLVEGLVAELPRAPPLEPRLSIRNLVLDGSQEVSAANLSWVLHDSALLDYLSTFLPIKQWAIDSTVEPLSVMPTLASVVDGFTTWQGDHGYIDGNAVWTYLYDHKADFVPDAPDTFEVLTVGFVYDNRSMVFDGHEYTGLGGDGITAIFMQTHRLFTPDGAPEKGLTNTIAHETGHSLGYGHQFGIHYDADFVDGAMGYFREELTYGTFWEDALYRVYIREKQLEVLDLLSLHDPLNLSILFTAFYRDYQGLRLLDAYHDLVAIEAFLSAPLPVTTLESATDGNGAAIVSGGATVSDAVIFGFSATPTGSVVGFVCTLDGVASPCASPVAFANLSAGLHTFRVYAYDLAGRFTSPPPGITWTVETPLQATQALIDYVNSLPLAKSVKSNLLGPLLTAEKIISGGKLGYEAKACKQFDLFIVQVNTYEAKGRISPDVAVQLRAYALAIEKALGCV